VRRLRRRARAGHAGTVELDLDYANGVVDLDFYLEQRDALLGHP
jgi:hypothetical protein